MATPLTFMPLVLAPVVISCQQDSPSHNSQGSQLGKTDSGFYSLATCIEPSSTMKATEWEGSFQVGNNLISTCLRTEIGGVLL